MTKITIDGKAAVLKSGTSFKLTRENYMFSDSGDYTLDVTLPMRGCIENQRIFGAAHRIEVAKDKYLGKRYPFRLEALPVVIEGTAIVTSINQEEMKVQLLSGNSELNVRCTHEDGSNIYVDELDLGYCWETVWGNEEVSRAGSVLDPFHWFEEYPSLRKWLTMFLDRTLDSQGLAIMGISTANTMYGDSDHTDSVCLPIYSAEDGAWSNQMALNDYKEWASDSTNTMRYWGPRLHFENDQKQMLPGKGNSDSKGFILEADYSLAPQPYLCYVVERVMKALGYSVNGNAIRSSSMKNVFIANCKPTLEIKNILPHWTVKEFLKEVMMFCGVKFEAYNRIVQIKSSGSASCAVVKEITHVIDEYSVDIDQEAADEDLSVGNVGYKFNNPSSYMVLPDEVWDNAIVKEFDTLQERADFYDAIKTAEDRYKYLLVCPADTREEKIIINAEEALVPVDVMGPLRRDKETKDLAKELRIVPVEMSFDEDTFIHDTWVHQRVQNPETNVYYGQQERKEGGVAMITNTTRSFTAVESYSIYKALEGEEDAKDSKPDTMEVGSLGMQYSNHAPLASGDSSTVFRHEGGFGIPYIQINGRYSFWAGTPETFMLHSLPELNTSYGCDTQTEYQVQFLDNGDFSAMDTFLIRGRKFRCSKLELTIDEKGLQPMKRGYFHEVL